MPEGEEKVEKEIKDFENASIEEKQKWLKKVLDDEEEGCDVGK